MDESALSLRGRFLAEVELFLSESGWAPSRLGLTAVGDPSFVSNLRSGRDVKLGTVEKVQAAMAAERGRIAAERAEPPADIPDGAAP